jgi:hypothetical protein
MSDEQRLAEAADLPACERLAGELEASAPLTAAQCEAARALQGRLCAAAWATAQQRERGQVLAFRLALLLLGQDQTTRAPRGLIFARSRAGRRVGCVLLLGLSTVAVHAGLWLFGVKVPVWMMVADGAFFALLVQLALGLRRGPRRGGDAGRGQGAEGAGERFRRRGEEIPSMPPP